MKLSARGRYIVIHPSFVDYKTWEVIQFDKRGHWQSGSKCESEAEAKAERSRLYRLHRQLAAESMARSYKRFMKARGL